MALKSQGKLALITIIPLVLITLLVTGVFYWNGIKDLESQATSYRNELITTHKNTLIAHLRMGRTAIQSLYESDKNGENKEAAKAILKAMRFADDGYFFAYNSKGINTLHAVKPSLEGKDLSKLKDENGVLVEALSFKPFTELADVFINFRDHSVEGCQALGFSLLVWFGVRRRTNPRPVRCVGRQINEERFILLHSLINELPCCGKEHIRAIAFDFRGNAILEECVVEITVVPVIRQHTDRASVVTQHLIEPTMFGAKRVIVTQMPLAEHSSRVASVLKGGAHDEFVGPRNEIGRKHVVNAGPVSIPTRQ